MGAEGTRRKETTKIWKVTDGVRKGEYSEEKKKLIFQIYMSRFFLMIWFFFGVKRSQSTWRIRNSTNRSPVDGIADCPKIVYNQRKENEGGEVGYSCGFRNVSVSTQRRWMVLCIVFHFHRSTGVMSMKVYYTNHVLLYWKSLTGGFVFKNDTRIYLPIQTFLFCLLLHPYKLKLFSLEFFYTFEKNLWIS